MRTAAHHALQQRADTSAVPGTYPASAHARQGRQVEVRPAWLAIAIVLSFVCITSARTETISFYKETDKFWSVYGDADTETGQVTCYGSAGKKDGSWIQSHRSLVDGELWAIIRNTAWEIDGEGRGTLRWNFYSPNKDAVIDGTEFTYDIRNKNTILGNLQNLSVSFERKGSTVLDALAECVAKNEKKYEDFKPSLERIPDAVKDKIWG